MHEFVYRAVGPKAEVEVRMKVSGGKTEEEYQIKAGDKPFSPKMNLEEAIEAAQKLGEAIGKAAEVRDVLIGRKQETRRPGL